MIPMTSNPPAPVSKSVVITPSPALATAFPTTPVAVLIPITSTDFKGIIAISSNAAIAYPIIISSTNTQGNIVLSTSLSTASVSVSLPTIISSTNAQGTIVSSTAHLPAVIITTTNAAGSKILTTSLLSLPTLPASAPAPLIIINNNSETITPNSNAQYIISGSTLSAGGCPITLGSGSSTTVLALQTSGSETALVYSPSTSARTPIRLLTTPPVITIGSDITAANSETQYIVGSQMLTADGVVTVNGMRVSLAAGKSDVVVGSSTEALAPYIVAGFGSGANGTGVQVFAGSADKRWVWAWGWREMWLLWTVTLGAVMWA